jgi:hypothetical protein
MRVDKKTNELKLNKAEKNIILTLLNFNQFSKADSQLKDNLDEKYKSMKYKIIKEYKREDGWMTYKAISTGANITKTKISESIAQLLPKGIVIKKANKWKRLKTGTIHERPYIYKLNPSWASKIPELVGYGYDLDILDSDYFNNLTNEQKQQWINSRIALIKIRENRLKEKLKEVKNS